MKRRYAVKHQKVRYPAVGAAMMAALLVTACSGPASQATDAAPASPSASTSTMPTPTPTPTLVRENVEAPRSQEEAVAAATAAMQTYLEIRAEIEREHPADSSAINTIATGEAADDMHTIASEVAESGRIFSGSYAFDVTTAYATDLTLGGTLYPFGHAVLDGCYSSEGISVTNADGTPAPTIANRRGIAQVSAFYVAAESKWFLTELGIPGTEVVPC